MKELILIFKHVCIVSTASIKVCILSYVNDFYIYICITINICKYIYTFILGFNPDTRQYDINIGIGLASSRNIPLGNKIVYFVGEILEVGSPEHALRVAKGETSYMIEIGALFVMDCFKRRHVCLASMCNSWKRIAKPDHRGRPILAQQNCKIVVDIPNRIVSLVAIRNIIRFEELFSEYGPGYGF